MLHVINLVPGMPKGWREAHPAPWRGFPNYLWLDKKRGVPGQDLPWLGPGTLEQTCDRITRESQGVYVQVSAASGLNQEDLCEDVIVVNPLCGTARAAVLVRTMRDSMSVDELRAFRSELKKTLLTSSLK